MSTATDTAIANDALSMVGGHGEADYKIDSIDGSGAVSVLCSDKLAIVRPEVLCDADWNEATKYADLGDDLKDTQITISSITVADSIVTVTTESAHGKSTGDTLYLLDIAGTGGITSLNGTEYTITVVNTTSFTLDSTTGSSSWSYTADSGVISDAPESADWEYAFALPGDYLGRCRQINESYHRSTKHRYITEYDKKVMQGFLFTNHLTNADDDSAYISYIYNLTDSAQFSKLLRRAIVTKLAAEISPVILVDQGKRRLELLREYENLALPKAVGQNQMEDSDDEYKGEYTTITCRTT